LILDMEAFQVSANTRSICMQIHPPESTAGVDAGPSNKRRRPPQRKGHAPSAMPAEITYRNFITSTAVKKIEAGAFAPA